MKLANKVYPTLQVVSCQMVGSLLADLHIAVSLEVVTKADMDEYKYNTHCR